MTKAGMFSEARDFTKIASSKNDHVRIQHEAARVAFVMQNFLESIDYLQKCAMLEHDQNAETFSDIARCIHLIGDVERSKKEGMENIDKALKINYRCANAWLNKGNI